MSDGTKPYAPIAEMLPTDGAQVSDLPLGKIPGNQNFAGDADIKAYCQSTLFPLVTRVKNRRRLLEDEWLAIQRLATLTHDGGQKYRGRSNVYLPTYATARATLASQLSRGLFPSDDYMDVESLDIDREDEAQQVKMALKYEFDCNAKIRAHMKPALLQMVDTGNMVVKYWYRTGEEFIGKKSRGNVAQFNKRPRKGLCVSARSVFNVVVYPETAEDEKDILITAEYIDMDKNYIMALGNSQRWLNVEEVLAGSNTSDLSQYARDQQIMDQAKIPGMLESVDGSDPREPTAQLLTVIECYVSMRLPKAAYVEGEDTSLPIPARVVMVKGVPLCVTRNPHYDQTHPYLWSRVGVVPGSFYGSWAGRRARHLQYLINDFANQTNDTGILGLNPFAVVDTNLLTGPLQPFAPGRVIRTRDAKNAIQFQHPPMEPIQYGQNIMGMYISALMDNTGAPPVLQGSKGADTATASSILQRNSLSPLQDIVEDIEAQMMVPLMERAWRLTVQFTDRAITVVDPMTGQKRQITPADLDEFDYNFKFLSSSMAANQQARAQQAIQLLQLVPSLVQLLQMNGKGINPEIVLKRLYTDGFGWRQFDHFVFPLQPAPMPMPGQGMGMTPPQGQGAPQGPQQPPAPPQTRSPEQNEPTGMLQSQGPAPTDAGDFEATRAITDELNKLGG
jgi:hypothetical protein